MRLGALFILLIAACDDGSTAASPTYVPPRAVPTDTVVVAPPAPTPAPPTRVPAPVTTAHPAIVVSSTQTGADQSTFDYGSLDDIFVRVRFGDGSYDGHLLRLTLRPSGGAVLTAYQTRVVSGTATFDFAVSGTVFGRNAQTGQFTFEVSDLASQSAIGQRDVQLTTGGHP